jgi:integrase
VKFTTDAVAALTMPRNKTDHIEWDSALPGFGVRMRGTDKHYSKSWHIQYRVNQQQRKESLGDTRKVALDAARKIARQRFAQAQLGTDPVAQRNQAKAAAKAKRSTIASVATLYLEDKQQKVAEGKRRARTYTQSRLHLLGPHWAPIANRPIDELKREEIAARLKEIIKEHGRTAARRARDNLSALYSWSMREGFCEKNPVMGTNNPTEGDKPRDRVLEDFELATIWNACADDDFGCIIKLLVLTGCRREEIGGLRWSEIDLATGTITIPATRTKNYRTHKLKVPQIALDILRSIERRDGRDFVFGARGSAYCAWSYATGALLLRIATNSKPLAHWTLHDLRRTMRTGLSRLGVPPHVAELCINHTRKNSVEATYDRYSYEKEIANALARWADHVGDVVEGRQRKVVPLRA